MSPTIINLSAEAYSRKNDRATVFNHFFDILVQVGNLSAHIRDISDTKAPLDSLLAVMQEALQLDMSLVSWANSLSPAFSYTVIKNPCVYSEENDRYPYRSVYGESYHVYPNIRSAAIWNYYRLLRIVLHEMFRNIRLRLPKGVSRSKNKMVAFQIVEITKEMAEGICASVPYHFSLGEAVVGAVYRLLWPFYVVSDCAGSTSRMRKWILQTLDKIGHTTGLRQALAMSQRLKEHNGLDWLTVELDKMTDRL
ncbi:uncharacterized protein PFLUO_LOCUS4717 [Penicillium psychrofluorescens]|uniref:uncharacterized protein n=1 Tax=Penicillium psychrofluorescens TaxID=3158075 RepID=UPI003CCD54E3